MWVQSLGWKDPPGGGPATYSSILVWRIPWTEEPSRLQFKGSHRVGHGWSNLAYHLGSHLLTSIQLNAPAQFLSTLRPSPPFALCFSLKCLLVRSFHPCSSVQISAQKSSLPHWWHLHYHLFRGALPFQTPSVIRYLDSFYVYLNDLVLCFDFLTWVWFVSLRAAQSQQY